MGNLIEVSSLSKSFGLIRAVDHVEFAVGKGEVLGFLGPNGAGKTTTMRMIAGYLAPSSGNVRIDGLDVASHAVEAKRRIGYLPEGAPLYGDMTTGDFLDFVAAMRGLDGKVRHDRIAIVTERLSLRPVMAQRIDTLSKGFRRRVGIAQAIVHDPAVLILDEPTDGLDPNQKQEMRSLIGEMAKEKAIVLSTHLLEEVDAICTRAIIIDQGKIRLDEPLTTLHKRGKIGDVFRTLTTTSEKTAA